MSDTSQINDVSDCTAKGDPVTALKEHIRHDSGNAEAAVELEAGAVFDLTVGGAVELESGDIIVTAGAVEIESALFTVE